MYLAFFACWMIQLLIGITVRNPLTVVLFVCFNLLNKKADSYSYKLSNINKIGFIISLILSGVVTFVFRKRVTAAFTSAVFKLLAVMILFVGAFSLCLIIYKYLISLLIKDKELKEVKENSKLTKIRERYYELIDSPKKVFILTFGLCLIGWLPYFLYEFPGIMTADSLVQFEQITGVRDYSNHHPVAHTLLIKLFHSIGRLFTADRSVAISFYTVFQELFFATCLATGVRKVRELLDAEGFVLEVISILFFAFVPFNAVFAVTIWKDIPFAAITILLVCHVITMQKRSEAQIKDFVIMAVLGILFALFRSNAWYAFILWTPIFIYTFRKDLEKAIITMTVVIVTVALIKGPVMNSLGVGKPDFVESLSVPTAQIARVLVNDRKLTPKQQELIDNCIDTTYIHELYAPDYADNIKELVRAGNVEYLEAHKRDYLKLWIELGTTYFPDYVTAWYDLLGGYIYPDFAYSVGDIDGIMTNEMDLVWKPQIGGKIVVKSKEILIKLGDFIPIYGMMWSIGTYFWFLVVTLIICIRKKISHLESWLLLLMMGTLLIAAPNLEFRYAYSIVLIWPILIAKAKGKKTLPSTV